MSGAHQPRTRVSLRGPAAIVVECLLPSVLLRVREPGTGLALWRRPTRVGLHRAVGALLATDRFCLTAEGDPGAASRALMRDLPVAGRTLEHDVAFLARLFATVTQAASVRLRLEHVSDNACRRHHVDAVRLRLLCTYAGPGTEWVDAAGERRRMPRFQVGIFKGSAYPEAAPRVLHRSPPVEHLPPRRRSRLLLCIDELEAPR
jgi:hypothetical protein